jgi:fructose-1,6-bisphosphatase/inositol monophosphatase family enzyme
MHQESSAEEICRYCRQIVLKTMDTVRSRMRGSYRLSLKEPVADPATEKSELNLTKGIDREAEDLIVAALQKKFGKIDEIGSFTVFSEELGIRSFPKPGLEDKCEWVVFVDPIDGTEFIENLQGGWVLLAVYNRKSNEVVSAVAGDIFLNRLYWGYKDGYPECFDLVTHSWFKLDGGPHPKNSLYGARVNFLTSKVQRFLSVAKQERLLKAIEKGDGRINLSWGSNLIIQVAAGYADVAVEFTKGFATYDILPGLFLGEQAGLTILDLKGNPVTTKLDIDEIFRTYHANPAKPARTAFVASKDPNLAREVLGLLDL